MNLYELISPENIDKLGSWKGQTHQFNKVVGYSFLGHFFLSATSTNEFAVLYPFKQAMKNYGKFTSIETFEKEILKDDGFIEFVLDSEHVASVFKNVGSLKQEEVYIPNPYPMLGGSCEPNTYSKGNVWVFAELVGQCHGF